MAAGIAQTRWRLRRALRGAPAIARAGCTTQIAAPQALTAHQHHTLLQISFTKNTWRKPQPFDKIQQKKQAAATITSPHHQTQSKAQTHLAALTGGLTSQLKHRRQRDSFVVLQAAASEVRLCVPDESNMQAASFATRSLTRAPLGLKPNVRHMSSHGSPEQNEKMMQLWTYTTFAALPVLAGLGFYMMSQPHDHHEQPSYPYLKKRDRPTFPWGSSCDLFDFNCKQGE